VHRAAARRDRNFNRGGSTIRRVFCEIIDRVSTDWRAAACPLTRSYTTRAVGTAVLVDFASDDRHARPDDGERWTTPLRGHRDVDGLRLPREGDAIWHDADKPAWRYGRFTILRLQYNVPDADLPRAAAIGAHEATAR
jgi:hypothetical protein